jgi:hypothetical protein
VPELKQNLLSVEQLVQNGYAVHFEKNGYKIIDRHGQVLANIRMEDNKNFALRMKYKMSEHNMFDEISQELDKVIKQNLEVEEEENDERHTITIAQHWMKQQLSVVTAEMVMFITTEEKKPPASQLERKSVETKLKEGMEQSEVKPYVGNLGGSTQEVMDVVVEALFVKHDSTKKVVNYKKEVIERPRAKRRKRRPRAKRRKRGDACQF